MCTLFYTVNCHSLTHSLIMSCPIGAYSFLNSPAGMYIIRLEHILLSLIVVTKTIVVLVYC